MKYLNASELLAAGSSKDNHHYVASLYEQMFARTPPDEEIDTYLELLDKQAISRLKLIRILASSSEALEACCVYYHWRDLLHPDADFLPDAYLLLLNRDIDRAGRSFQQERIDSGSTTRAGILLSLAASEEYRPDISRVTLDGLTEFSTTPTVNIVIEDRCSPLRRLATELERRLPYITICNKITDAQIQYFIPYTLHRASINKLTAALFTNVEQDAAWGEQFRCACNNADLAVYMSTTIQSIIESNSNRSARIQPGVDLDEFQIIPIRVGLFRESYNNDSKDDAFVSELRNIQGITCHFMDHFRSSSKDVCSAHEMHRFYSDIDYLLIPHIYDGWSTVALDALACGKATISPPVQIANNLPHIHYPEGDVYALRELLFRLVEDRARLRRSVQHLSWETWARQHHTQFQIMLGQLTPLDSASSAPDIQAEHQSQNVAVILHKPEGRGRFGGPSRRALETAISLKKVGRQVTVYYDTLPHPPDANIAHIFNVWEPQGAVELLRSAKRRRLQTVFSSIFLDLSAQRPAEAVTSIFNEAKTFTEIDERLNILSDLHAENTTDRRGSVNRLLPGFVSDVSQMLSLTDHLVLTSDCERRLLIEYGLDLPENSVVHNAPSEQLLSVHPSTNLPPVIASGDYILCVGNLEPRKNQLLLLHACRHLNKPIVFVGAGTNSTYGRLIQRYATPWTHLLSHIDDDSVMRAIYSNAAVFVLPSWAEGAPLSALEAGSFGVPLVLSSQSSEREYFGRYSHYCDPWSAESIEEAVRLALDQNDRTSREVRASFVQKTYNYKRVSSELNDIYQMAARKSLN